jgi:hypothetical protein
VFQLGLGGNHKTGGQGRPDAEQIVTQPSKFESKLLDVRDRLSDLLPDLDVKSVCGFIAGLAFAQDEDPLLGFDQWLRHEFQIEDNDLPWPILLCVAFEKNGIGREDQAAAGFDAFFRFRAEAGLDAKDHTL